VKAHWITILASTCLFLVDSFVLNQGFVSAVVILIVLLVLLPRALWAYRTCRNVGRRRLTTAAIYLVAAFAVLSANAIQNRIADQRAVVLGNACLAFHGKYHRYPQRLQELVPEFISALPAAKSLSGIAFVYVPNPSGGEPMLFYEAVPPFGRRFYHIESRSWGFLD
jgi:hypothetical protein